MKSQRTLQFLLRIAVILAIPTMACTAYYTLERLGDANTHLTAPVALAFPLLLIGLVSTVSVVMNGKRTNARLAASLLCLIVPLLFLASIWL